MTRLPLKRCKTSSSREEYKSDTTYTTLGLQSQGGYMSFELCQGGATGSMERLRFSVVNLVFFGYAEHYLIIMYATRVPQWLNNKRDFNGRILTETTLQEQ